MVMVEKLIERGIVEVLPVNTSFFQHFNLHANVKLSKELIDLNYARYSPFKESKHLFYFNEEDVFIWFYEEDTKAPIVIPEAYLLYKALVEDYNDTLLVVESTPSKIFLIKDKKLLNSIGMKTLDENVLQMMMEEHQISSKIVITEAEYGELYQSSLQKISIKDLWRWNQLEIDKNTILPTIIDKIAYPVSALMIFIIFVNSLHTYTLHSSIQNKEDIYHNIKQNNDDIRSLLRKENQEAKRWNHFINEELVYPDAMSLLYSIIDTLDEKVFIKEVSINGDKMLLKLQTDMSPILYLNKLNKLEYFSDVMIESSRKQNDGTKLINYILTLKLLSELQ